MQQPQFSPPQQNHYDPRWFVWTIVFLVVTGISLVSYIMLSNSGTDDLGLIQPVHVSAHKTTATK